MAEKGKFIVLEGIDGSGKTTQIERLVPAFLFIKQDVLATREPYDEPENEVGFHIRQILLGKEENPGYRELQKMFVLARKWHLENIVIPALESGKHILCDRYVASTYAYHRSKGGVFDEVRRWHSDWYYPADITIWIDVYVKIALERMKSRESEKELFDARKSMVAIHNAYRELLGHGDKYIPNFRIVDGNRPPSYVGWDIMDICGELIPGLDREGANGFR